MAATFIGVRHHSPACARLVRATIERLRPVHVLVEGPADMNDRLDELLLEHELPVAIFSSYRDRERSHASWSPFCAYSPEWVALTAGRGAGARLRFIDLPAWHPALAASANRYADAERRYSAAVDRLCERFAVDNVDALWDQLFEVEPPDGIEKRLEAYFDLVRGDAAASEADAQREDHMAAWVRAALADAAGRPVVVVTGGFHRPAIETMSRGSTPSRDWPAIPSLPAGAVGGSYVVPFSYRRLDAFDGYQSGMPSPQYYHHLWELDPSAAGDRLVAAVVARLRARKQPVSTADLIAARSLSDGLARLRGRFVPARVDVLDGLLAALVTDPLEVRPPWTGRGQLREGTEPVVVEMIAALSGDRVGRLHPDTSLPPLVHDVEAELERHEIPDRGTVHLDLAGGGLPASRVLHRLRVLSVPGVRRLHGPSVGADPVLVEEWTIEASELRLPALIEAGAYGATLPAAAGAALQERFLEAGGESRRIALTLFDAALCGLGDLSERVTGVAAGLAGQTGDLPGLGFLLAVALGLWRHDRIFGAARSAELAPVVAAAVRRLLWLAEGIRGGPAPADRGRLAAVAAVRDAVLHAEAILDVEREAVIGVFHRLSAAQGVPPDLRGAGLGFGWALGRPGDVARSVRGAGRPEVLGDWLAGLFALAREEVVASEGGTGAIAVVDELVGGMAESEFLVALPALRQAFAYFPPRERERIARLLLDARGLHASARSLTRIAADPGVFAWAREVEERVEGVLRREALSGGH